MLDGALVKGTHSNFPVLVTEACIDPGLWENAGRTAGTFS